MTAYIVITSTAESISVQFNAYSSYTGFVRSKWRIEEMVSVVEDIGGSVTVRAKSGLSDYPFSHDGTKGLKVDSVNGVVPTSASHLFDLIASCVG